MCGMVNKAVEDMVIMHQDESFGEQIKVWSGMGNEVKGQGADHDVFEVTQIPALAA